ncbi:MAG: hypothetical protein ACYS74_24360 [Planctomycetota bacterium]
MLWYLDSHMVCRVKAGGWCLLKAKDDRRKRTCRPEYNAAKRISGSESTFSRQIGAAYPSDRPVRV